MDNIYKIKDRFGLWSVADFQRINGTVYCLLEPHVLKEDSPCVVVNGNDIKMFKRKVGPIPEFQKEISETYVGLLPVLCENEIITDNEREFLENGGCETPDMKKCPHCRRILYPSQVDGYTYQCFHCDEDFYSIEAVD